MRFPDTVKGYKTRRNAMRRLTLTCEYIAYDEFAACIHVTKEGTFVPVIFLRADQTHFARTLAEEGVYVVG